MAFLANGGSLTTSNVIKFCIELKTVLKDISHIFLWIVNIFEHNLIITKQKPFKENLTVPKKRKKKMVDKFVMKVAPNYRSKISINNSCYGYLVIKKCNKLKESCKNIQPHFSADLSLICYYFIPELN